MMRVAKHFYFVFSYLYHSVFINNINQIWICISCSSSLTFWLKIICSSGLSTLSNVRCVIDSQHELVQQLQQLHFCKHWKRISIIILQRWSGKENIANTIKSSKARMVKMTWPNTVRPTLIQVCMKDTPRFELPPRHQVGQEKVSMGPNTQYEKAHTRPNFSKRFRNLKLDVIAKLQNQMVDWILDIFMLCKNSKSNFSTFDSGLWQFVKTM